MKQLPSDVIIQIQSNTLWSREEEMLLAKTAAVCLVDIVFLLYFDFDVFWPGKL